MNKLELAPGSRTDHPKSMIDRSDDRVHGFFHAWQGGSTCGWRTGPAHLDEPGKVRRAGVNISAVSLVAAALTLGLGACGGNVRTGEPGGGTTTGSQEGDAGTSGGADGSSGGDGASPDDGGMSRDPDAGCPVPPKGMCGPCGRIVTCNH